jgi:uncharacterized LabA/DUF88 family protein
MNTRAIAYIDGFNLYYGMRQAGFKKLAWLNISQLSRSLLQPSCNLLAVKYCTARIRGPEPNDTPERATVIRGRRDRQAIYLSALETVPEVSRFEGHYLSKPLSCFYCHKQLECRFCGKSQKRDEEKMTDVNIATELLLDAFDDKFDVALLISADSDLVPPIRTVRNRFSDKTIMVAFPPCRQSTELSKTASTVRRIRRSALEKSQFPDEITLRTGYRLCKPVEWR